MRVVFIFPVADKTPEIMKNLRRSLNQIMAVRFVEVSEFVAPSFDIQFAIVSSMNADFKSDPAVLKLVTDSDMAISNVFHPSSLKGAYKIFKDRHQCVRDVSEYELIITIGKNYGIYRSQLANELEQAERQSKITEVTDQIENTLQLLHTSTDQSDELNKIRELLKSLEGI